MATDEAALLLSDCSSSSLLIAPTSHSNIGRFFNCPSPKKKNSILPSTANIEMVRFCIETQVRILFQTIRLVKKGEHLVWEYNYK